MIKWLRWLMAWRLYWINSSEVWLDYTLTCYEPNTEPIQVFIPSERGEYRIIIVDISHRSQALKTDAILKQSQSHFDWYTLPPDGWRPAETEDNG